MFSANSYSSFLLSVLSSYLLFQFSLMRSYNFHSKVRSVKRRKYLEFQFQQNGVSNSSVPKVSNKCVAFSKIFVVSVIHVEGYRWVKPHNEKNLRIGFTYHVYKIQHHTWKSTGKVRWAVHRKLWAKTGKQVWSRKQ
jgi:hypothetical protein